MKKSLFFIALIALLCVFYTKAGSCYAYSDSFDYYEVGPLNGNGSWTCADSDPYFALITTEAYNTPANSVGSHGRVCQTTFTAGGANIMTIELKLQYSMTFILRASAGPSDRQTSLIDCSGGTCFWKVQNTDTIFTGISKGVWHEYKILYNDATGKFQAALDGGDLSAEYDLAGTGEINTLYIAPSGPWGWGTTYFDDVEIVSAGPSLTITSPANASTITDDTTNLTFSWSGIDHTEWDDIGLAFNDLKINETSKTFHYTITTDSGSYSIPLSTFEITKNGDWTLRSVVSSTITHQINFDIPSVSYGLTFNIPGLPSAYYFTDFDTWYANNVPDYEIPSGWAEAMVGFVQPVFEKIGEFGNRITNYLDVADAGDKGFQIGGIFPVVIAYVNKIDLFFGGFPIVQFFKWGILLMILLFGVKVILKLLSFIPFFGGGG